jgi:hypothetical protein
MRPLLVVQDNEILMKHKHIEEGLSLKDFIRHGLIEFVDP